MIAVTEAGGSQIKASGVPDEAHSAAALAPAGVLLVVGHDVANLTERAGGPPDPAVLYTPESITRALGGLTVVRAERVRRPVAAGQAVDSLVRAVRD